MTSDKSLITSHHELHGHSQAYKVSRHSTYDPEVAVVAWYNVLHSDKQSSNKVHKISPSRGPYIHTELSGEHVILGEHWRSIWVGSWGVH